MSQKPSVEQRGDLIIVTLPGTGFSATYSRVDGHPPGISLQGATTDPAADLSEIYQFRADAFAAATQKARLLGWIV